MSAALPNWTDAWGDSMSVTLSVGKQDIVRNNNWPASALNKLVAHRTDKPDHILGIYEPSFERQDTPGIFDGTADAVQVIEVLMHNGVLWVAAQSMAAPNNFRGRLIMFMLIDPWLPRAAKVNELTGLPESLQIKVLNTLYFDAVEGEGFGKDFSVNFGGPFSTMLQPFQDAAFITDDVMKVNLGDSIQLFKFYYDYHVQDDDRRAIYSMRNYQADGERLLITERRRI